MPGADGDDQTWEMYTSDVKVVSDYAGVSFTEAWDMDCMLFRVLFRDGYISMLSQTEDGRKYLEDCYVLTLQSPNRQKLREKYGG